MDAIRSCMLTSVARVLHSTHKRGVNKVLEGWRLERIWR